MADPYKRDVDQLVQALSNIVECGWGSGCKTLALQALTDQRQREVSRGAQVGTEVSWQYRP